MKQIITITLAAALLTSCDFLDIVPDNVPQYEDVFASKNAAYAALAVCYSGLPSSISDISHEWLGDNYAVVFPEVLNYPTNIGPTIMRGLRSPSAAWGSHWTGNVVPPLYNRIREIDNFLLNIDAVPDMTAEEKGDWRAQVTFLKGFYMFMLVLQHGPVVLPQLTSPDSPNEAFFLPRVKIDECFDYILALMDEAINSKMLQERSSTYNYSMIDMCAAKALKARVLFFRASPFFNDNTEFYERFLDPRDNQPFFPQNYDAEKWKTAIDAINDAIETCTRQKLGLYHYKGAPYQYDAEDYAANPDNMQTHYDLRHIVCDPWNEEIIWGRIDFSYATNDRSSAIQYKSTLVPLGVGGSSAYWAGASYNIMERFQTVHGLPLLNDRTVNTNTLHKITVTPDESSPDYAALRGIMAPGVQTVEMYLNREPRFYANLGITGGIYRSEQTRFTATMYAGTAGGYRSGSTWYIASGIGVQKYSHPESTITIANGFGLIHFPTPNIRMTDLYLMRAEAVNEYYGPTAEALADVNMIRRRAGLPDVEEAYANTEWADEKVLNRHTTKEGLREIIYQERDSEFAFEPPQFWDRLRTKTATSVYSKPLYGWNYLATDAESFFIKTELQGREWSNSAYLWPIARTELERNSLLVQNPGY